MRLVFSRSLRDNDLVWLVDYLPRDDVELRAFFDDENERAYEFRHAVTLGATPRDGADSRSSARRPARVSSLEFSDAPGSDAARLPALVSLRVGDRFDFHRWQRDRDRVEAYYFERGFLEARVRARREQPAGSDAVALRYEISRGPETALAVTGYDLPASVRRDLEAIWGGAVFDTFLIEEVSARVAEHLADRGYLRATVDVRIDARRGGDAPVAEDDARTVTAGAEDGPKRVVIRIDPGPRTDDRRVVFEGVTPADEPELRSMVESLDLASVAWTDPDRFAATVTAWYRGRGRLRATATVEAPRFDWPDGAVAGPRDGGSAVPRRRSRDHRSALAAGSRSACRGGARRRRGLYRTSRDGCAGPHRIELPASGLHGRTHHGAERGGRSDRNGDRPVRRRRRPPADGRRGGRRRRVAHPPGPGDEGARHQPGGSRGSRGLEPGPGSASTTRACSAASTSRRGRSKPPRRAARTERCP